MSFKVWFLAFSFPLFAFTPSSANALPTAEDIDSPAEAAKQIAETFMRESLNLRMQYEFSGKFLTQRNKANLKKIAERAGDQLQEIAESQRKLKQQIEDYESHDWDSRYGSTGLWRKLFADLYATRLSKCEIDLYLALTAQQAERDKILHKILVQIDSLEQIHDAAYAQFLRAKTLALLARTDSACKPLAKKEFDALMERSDMRHSTVFRIEIERIKFLGLTEPDRLGTVAENIAKSRCADDLELVLYLASLQHRYDPKGFEKTANLFPQTEGLLGSLVLSDLSNRFDAGQLTTENLEQTNVFEAELAAQAAWKSNPAAHKTLLENFADMHKFQTPLILYVTAVAFADSSPAKTVELLIKASKLQSAIGGQKSDKLGIGAEEIAKQAAQLAYNSFAKDLLNCQLTTEAFENYLTITQGRVDEELEYRYVTILNICSLSEKAKKLLQKIADRPAGKCRNRARLDLVLQAIQEKQHEKQEHRSELLKQLSDLIASCASQNDKHDELRIEAITIYCQLLLESKDKGSAQKVLNVITKADTIREPNLNVFKSKALRQLGRLGESADCLLFAIDPNRCEHANEAMELLSEVIDKIDYYQAKKDDFPKMVQNCYKLASFCYNCFDGRQNRWAGLLLAEVSVFAAEKEKGKLPAVENLLNNLAGDANDVNLLRCRARLLSEQDKFCEAAGLWAQVAKIRESESPSANPVRSERDLTLKKGRQKGTRSPGGTDTASEWTSNGANQRNWKWWRAKFYELYCWSKCPQAQKENIPHTIDVLDASFTDIPPLWAEKLKQLKQQAGS